MRYAGEQAKHANFNSMLMNLTRAEMSRLNKKALDAGYMILAYEDIQDELTYQPAVIVRSADLTPAHFPGVSPSVFTALVSYYQTAEQHGDHLAYHPHRTKAESTAEAFLSFALSTHNPEKGIYDYPIRKLPPVTEPVKEKQSNWFQRLFV